MTAAAVPGHWDALWAGFNGTRQNMRTLKNDLTNRLHIYKGKIDNLKIGASFES